MAPLDAAYQTYSPGLPMVEAAEEMLTMTPGRHGAAIMRRTASRAAKMAPVTLMSMHDADDFGIGLREGAALAGDAGIVDECGHGAELLLGLVEHASRHRHGV